MKIHYSFTIEPETPNLTLKAFCDVYGITVRVWELDAAKPWGAELVHCDVADNGLIGNAVEFGASPHEALALLSEQISGKVVAIVGREGRVNVPDLAGHGFAIAGTGFTVR